MVAKAHRSADEEVPVSYHLVAAAPVSMMPSQKFEYDENGEMLPEISPYRTIEFMPRFLSYTNIVLPSFVFKLHKFKLKDFHIQKRRCAI